MLCPRASVPLLALILAGCSAAEPSSPTPSALAESPVPVTTPTASSAPASALASGASVEPPSPTPPPTPPQTSEAAADPTPTRATPSVALLGNSLARISAGAAHVGVEIQLVAEGLDLSQCTLEYATLPDKPSVASTVTLLQPLARQTVDVIDGRNTFTATCASSEGPLSAELWIRARDGQPERCADFVFEEGPLTAADYDTFRAGMVGTWEGCVETPWTPAYWIILTFRADGTYDAVSTEALDGEWMNALYWGDDSPTPQKRWTLDDIQASGLGIGSIDLTFGSPPYSVVREELRHIALMGDRMRLELFSMGVNGSLELSLYRAATSD